MKKLLLIISIFLLSINVYADDLEISAPSAILMEASTGKVLFEKNANEPLSPASMTKMMTLLITMENVDNGVIKLSDKVTVSKNASDMGGSQVYLEESAQYTLEEIIKAVCIASGNDAAVVLAETIGGNVESFVNMMNKKAKELGLSETNFVNPYGLDADGHQSSAMDMAKIARELLKHETILKYTSIYEDHLQKKDGTSLWMVNTNKLVRFYNGVDGLKTGFTDKAGYCMTATGMWNDLRLIAVVMKEESSDNRNKDITAMLNYGKSNYKIKKVLRSNKPIGKLKVSLGENKTSDVYLKEDVSYLYKSNDKIPKYTYKVKTNKVTAPLKKGSIIGKAKIYEDNKYKETRTIIINNDIKKCSFLTLFKRILGISVSGTY